MLLFPVFVVCTAMLVLPAAAQAQGSFLRMEEITVEGQIQKPQASFILQRSGKIDLGVDVRSLRPVMSKQHLDLPEREPDLFRTDKRQ